MVRFSWALILLFIFTGFQGESQGFIEKKNLQSDWLVYTETGYSDFSATGESTNTLYFSINSDTYRGDYLQLKNADYFSILLNGILIIDGIKEISLSIDSLSNLNPDKTLFVALHQEKKISKDRPPITIITSKVITVSSMDEIISERRSTSFRDFVITAILILLLLLVLVVKLNPKLSLDYFSIPKLFSLRESEEDQFYYRATSTNILFYLFTSLVLSLFFMVVGQSIENGNHLNVLAFDKYIDHILAWIKMGLIILGLLFGKLLITYLIGLLFNVGEVSGLHFFNFIRLVLVMAGVLTAALTIYHITHGQQKGVYNFFYETLGWALGGWIILIFLKLTNRIRYSPFHLFSYICTTEIIPVLLIIKVLYK